MTIPDSLGLEGASPRFARAVACIGVSCQLSFAKIDEPLLLRRSRVGSSSGPVMSNAARDGPIPRATMFLVALPEMINPAIRTLLPVSTRIRVAIFRACGVAGVGVGVAVGVGVGLGVAVAVAVGVGVVD